MYDARGVKFDFNRQTFEQMHTFPPFPSELPRGSFAVIGHTVQLAKVPGEIYHVYHNAQWVLLLATPP